MGEAKRRKAKDPDWGTARSRLSIRLSDLTGNFLVMIDDSFCYDSASRKPDAEKVIADLIEYTKSHPLPIRHSATRAEYLKWTLETIGVIDIPDSVSFRWDRSTGEIISEILDFSESKELSPAKAKEVLGQLLSPLLDELAHEAVVSLKDRI